MSKLILKDNDHFLFTMAGECKKMFGHFENESEAMTKFINILSK